MSDLHPFGELTELHVHVGSAVDPPIMWEVAHEQGIKLPTKNYWEFEELITVSGITTYQKYLDLFHWTEIIQSSPEAMEKSIYSMASGAYRKNNITTLEIRFNPMKRNRGGERDLDHIIMASIHGMEKAMLAYPMRAGLVLCLDRTFEPELNGIIAQKAIKFAGQGVVGIDLAGPLSEKFHVADLEGMIADCRAAGLGVTIHTGEATGADEVKEVIERLKPQRIGHGVRSTEDIHVLQLLHDEGIVLEVCPTSNIHTNVIESYDEFKRIFSLLKEYDVKFTINTDGPEMLKTNLLSEYTKLIDLQILTKEDLINATEIARKASFIKE